MLINASIIIKRRKNKQIRIESMATFVFISGIHRTNGSDNEQLFGKSHSLFTAPKPGPRQRQSQAQARERQACGVSHAVPPRAPVCCGLFDLYQVVGTRCADRHHGLWHVGWSISITVCTHFNVDLKLFSSSSSWYDTPSQLKIWCRRLI